MGQIPTEYLPPKKLWLQRIYTLPEFIHLPQRFNSTEELLDKALPQRRGGRDDSR